MVLAQITSARALRPAAALLAVAAAIPASAAVTVEIRQAGGDVTTTASGSLDLAGLTLARSGVSFYAGVRGVPFFYGAGQGATTDAYTGFTGPGTAGEGGLLVQATATAGSLFSFNGNYPLTGVPTLFLAPGYVSGDALLATSLFAGTTIAGLGLTEGRYVFRSAEDTITFNIGGASSAVPEPAAWAAMVLGFCLTGTRMRRRRRTGAGSGSIPECGTTS